MKAAVIREFGDFDVLQVEEVPTPKPRAGYVLIKILAAGINRFEDYLREGSVVPELAFPHILGADAAGEIAALGDGVTGFKVGQRVIPVSGYPTSPEERDISPAATAPSFALLGLQIPGTYAQYVEVPAHFVLKDDTGLTPEEVATLPVVLSTSVRAVKTVGGVKAGDKVLIHAGAGGAGNMQIQVAKALGAEVATTIRQDSKAEVARKAGADLIINTTNEDFVAKVQEWSNGGVDVVIDSLGGEVLPKSIEAARPLGTIVAYGFADSPNVSFDIRSLFFAQKRLVGTMASDKSDLEAGLEMLKDGKIKPIVDRTLPLKKAAEAHRLLATSQIAGNVVLLPWAV